MVHAVKRFSPGRLALWMVLLFVTAVALVPFIMMLVMSTQNNYEIFSGASFRTGDHLMKNLESIAAVNFPRSMFNSLVIAVGTTVLSVFSSAMAGYAFAKWHFKGKK